MQCHDLRMILLDDLPYPPNFIISFLQITSLFNLPRKKLIEEFTVLQRANILELEPPSKSGSKFLDMAFQCNLLHSSIYQRFQFSILQDFCSFVFVVISGLWNHVLRFGILYILASVVSVQLTLFNKMVYFSFFVWYQFCNCTQKSAASWNSDKISKARKL